MCGITGIVEFKGQAASERTLRAMTNTIPHRGPDGEGFFVQGPVALGHRRLSIIDLGGGHQPMFNEDGSVVVVYNGEIFNFRDVQKALESKGHVFRTHCDTEVIAHAYEEYGERCVEHFRGMFAFAVYDQRSGSVLLGRDRLGIKPLYYHASGERLLFASEIKPILAALSSRPTVNRSQIDFQMSLGYVPGEQTLFKQICRLAPGHTLSIKNGGLKFRQYWEIAESPMLDIDENDAADRLDDLLTESVRLRLMSDVPLGAFLSGGVDSSAIVALMSKLTNEPVKTFSVGYRDDPASSELSFARVIADRFKTDHHEFILEPGDFFDSLDLLLDHMEEPVVESAAIALFQLSKLAREHVTVILSGEGGDEILAGYPLYRIMPMLDRIRALVGWLPSSLLSTLASVHGTEKAAKYADWIGAPLTSRYWGISNDVTASIKRRMYSPELTNEAGAGVRTHFENLFGKMRDATSLRRMTYVDLKTWLPDDLLVKADKMTMACSLELRVPMLDHKLLEYCTALPDNLRIRNGEGKYLLKRVMERYLPREIIYRPKKGFPVPIAAWFRGPLFEPVSEILRDTRSRARGYFKPSYVENVLQQHRSGAEDLSRRIFSLLALELWHRRYID